MASDEEKSVDQLRGELDAAREELARSHQLIDQLRSHLIQSEKMAALGGLVAGVAHEINTPIGAVCSMQDTLFRALEKLRSALDEMVPDHANNRKIASSLNAIQEAYKVIDSGTSRVLRIVKRLRRAARLDAGERQQFDIHEGLEDTLVLVQHQIKGRVDVEKHFGEIPQVECVPGQINQVFLNLLVNASQAIEGKGTITISTDAQGGMVSIAIADTGKGIAPENIERIFEPGFTTKEAAVGTGLGLAICREIISGHGGQITATGEPGKGATFTVLLPVNAPAA